MLKELWLDPCWNQCNSGVERVEGREVGPVPWLCDKSLRSDAEEDDDQKEEEKDEIGSQFSEYEDRASDGSDSEESSDKEYDSDSQWSGTSGPRDCNEDEVRSRSYTVHSKGLYDSRDQSVDVVLRLFYEMVTEDFEDGRSSSALLVYFSAVRGLSKEEGNEYLRPARYTPILSRLIYCTRLIYIEAVLPRRAHAYAGFVARPRYGQLAAFHAVRVNYMCDGTMSPLGEFFSLLAYGLTLQRSEGPIYHFDWSEDGQTISWDGDMRLSMGQFRNLAHEAFRQATAQSRRLMYDFVPEDPEIESLRDRLSKTTPGYSFLTDPETALLKY